MERLLWWVLAGSRGGASRARIMIALRQRPYNANQLAEALGLDYKTIRHHLEVLERNLIVVTEGQRYAKLYYLSKNMDGYYSLFEQICHKIGLEPSERPLPIERTDKQEPISAVSSTDDRSVEVPTGVHPWKWTIS